MGAGSQLWIWDTVNKVWVPLAGTAGGAMSIHAIVEELDDIEDVDLTGLADVYILYWDDASSTWKCKAIPAAAWADITGKPAAPSLEELATEHEADGTHGDITPSSCTEKYTDAEAKAAAVQAGVITDGVTKAPTHDAVYDVKQTADGAIAKTLLTAQGDIITRNATVPKRLALGTAGHVLTAGASEPAWAAPAAHKDSHDPQDGGDPLDCAAPGSISEAADAEGVAHSFARSDHNHQHLAALHETGGGAEISVAGLSGELADDQPPKAHEASHQSGGADILYVPRTYVWFVPGDVAIGTEQGPTFRMKRATIIEDVELHVKTAPTGAALIVDINEAGTTVFSTKPEIDIDGTTEDDNHVFSDTALAAAAELTMDIDQVGSTVAGKDLTVLLHCKEPVI